MTQLRPTRKKYVVYTGVTHLTGVAHLARIKGTSKFVSLTHHSQSNGRRSFIWSSPPAFVLTPPTVVLHIHSSTIHPQFTHNAPTIHPLCTGVR